MTVTRRISKIIKDWIEYNIVWWWSEAVDTQLDTTSENPVQNKVIAQAINWKQDTLTAWENVTIATNQQTWNLEISAKDTKYTNATETCAWLMSASDKKKLNSLSIHAVKVLVVWGWWGSNWRSWWWGGEVLCSWCVTITNSFCITVWTYWRWYCTYNITTKPSNADWWTSCIDFWVWVMPAKWWTWAIQWNYSAWGWWVSWTWYAWWNIDSCWWGWWWWAGWAWTNWSSSRWWNWWAWLYWYGWGWSWWYKKEWSCANINCHWTASDWWWVWSVGTNCWGWGWSAKSVLWDAKGFNWACWVLDICYKCDWSYWINSATWGNSCYVCDWYCVHRFTSNWTFTINW